MEWMRRNVENHFHCDTTVTFFRHGKTRKYEEDGRIEEDLVEEGEDAVRMSAIFLAEELKRRNEVALVWASPKKRTQQTAQIITQTLGEYGVLVYARYGTNEKVTSSDLLQSPNLTHDFWDQKSDGESFVSLWKELSDKNLLPEGTEHYKEHEDRLLKALALSIEIAKVQKNNYAHCPKLRIIAVCHFETVTPILQEAYGGDIGVARDKGLDKASYLHVDIYKWTHDDTKAILRVYFEKASQAGVNGNAYLSFSVQNVLTRIV